MIELIARNDVLRAATLLALFILVAAVAYAVFVLVSQRQIFRRRLMAEGSGGRPVFEGGTSLRASDSASNWIKLVNRIEKTGLSLTDTRDAQLRAQLAAAGYTAPYAPRVYTLIRLLLVIALPVAVLSYLLLAGDSPPGMLKLYLLVSVAALAGLYFPALFVRAKADRRRQELLNGFPDALDLLLVCVEAGLGLEASFNKVGMEMARSHPLLAEHLGALVLELRAGRSHEDAMRRMADRAGIDEFRAFSTLLIQSTKLGSSIAQTLRVYAGEMREKRRMRAEEKAHRLPVLLSVPLVACMLPCMIGVLMLPASIRIVRQLVPLMASGG